MEKENFSFLRVKDNSFPHLTSSAEINLLIDLFEAQVADYKIDEAVEIFCKVYPTLIYDFYTLDGAKRWSDRDLRVEQITKLTLPLYKMLKEGALTFSHRKLLYTTAKLTFYCDWISHVFVQHIGPAMSIAITLCVEIEDEVVVSSILDELQSIDFHISSMPITTYFYYRIAEFYSMDKALKFAEKNFYREYSLKTSVARHLMDKQGEDCLETVKELILPLVKEGASGPDEKVELMYAMNSFINYHNEDQELICDYFIQMFREGCSYMGVENYQYIKNNMSTEEWDELFPKLEEWAIMSDNAYTKQYFKQSELYRAIGEPARVLDLLSKEPIKLQRHLSYLLPQCQEEVEQFFTSYLNTEQAQHDYQENTNIFNTCCNRILGFDMPLPGVLEQYRLYKGYSEGFCLFDNKIDAENCVTLVNQLYAEKNCVPFTRQLLQHLEEEGHNILIYDDTEGFLWATKLSVDYAFENLGLVFGKDDRWYILDNIIKRRFPYFELFGKPFNLEKTH